MNDGLSFRRALPQESREARNDQSVLSRFDLVDLPDYSRIEGLAGLHVLDGGFRERGALAVQLLQGRTEFLGGLAGNAGSGRFGFRRDGGGRGLGGASLGRGGLRFGLRAHSIHQLKLSVRQLNTIQHFVPRTYFFFVKSNGYAMSSGFFHAISSGEAPSAGGA